MKLKNKIIITIFLAFYFVGILALVFGYGEIGAGIILLSFSAGVTTFILVNIWESK